MMKKRGPVEHTSEFLTIQEDDVHKRPKLIHDGRNLINKMNTKTKNNSLLEQMLKKDQQLGIALQKFRQTSEEELAKLTETYGLDVQAAIATLVDKIRGDHGEPFKEDPSEIKMVMDLASFTKVEAVRALVVKDELVKLRKKGIDAPKAVDELVERMKTFSGVKRRSFHESPNLENSLCTDETEVRGSKKLKFLQDTTLDDSTIQEPKQDEENDLIFSLENEQWNETYTMQQHQQFQQPDIAAQREPDSEEDKYQDLASFLPEDILHQMEELPENLSSEDDVIENDPEESLQAVEQDSDSYSDEGREFKSNNKRWNTFAPTFETPTKKPKSQTPSNILNFWNSKEQL